METYASMPEAGWRRCVLQESAVAASPMSDSKGGNESKRIVSPAKAGAQGNPHCLINGLPSAAGILRGISSLAPGSRFRGYLAVLRRLPDVKSPPHTNQRATDLGLPLD